VKGCRRYTVYPAKLYGSTHCTYCSPFFCPISFHLQRHSFLTTTPKWSLCMYLHISLQHLQSGHSCVDRWDWCYTQVGMVQLHCTPHCPRGYYHFHFQSRLHGVVQHLQHKKEIHCNHWYGYEYVLIKIDKNWNRAQWYFTFRSVKSQLSAHDTCIYNVPPIITDSTIRIVVADLHSAFSYWWFSAIH